MNEVPKGLCNAPNATPVHLQMRTQRSTHLLIRRFVRKLLVAVLADRMLCRRRAEMLLDGRDIPEPAVACLAVGHCGEREW